MMNASLMFLEGDKGVLSIFNCGVSKGTHQCWVKVHADREEAACDAEKTNMLPLRDADELRNFPLGEGNQGRDTENLFRETPRMVPMPHGGPVTVPVNEPKMTPKQKRFVAEYLVCLNATKAAIAAGYPKKSAKSVGQENLTKPDIAAAIAGKTQKAFGKLDYSVERTLQEIARLAFFDVANLFEDDGSLKRIADIDADSRAAIAGLEVTELFDPVQQKDGASGEPQKHVYGLLKKIKLADKGAALDKLMRYHSLYRDKVELTGKDDGPLEMRIVYVGQNDAPNPQPVRFPETKLRSMPAKLGA